VQLWTSASHCKGVGNITISHFMKAFSALPSHSQWCQAHYKSVVPSVLISVEGTGKNQLETGQESMGDILLMSHCSLLRNPWQNRPVCWSIVVKENPTVGSPFFGAYPSDRIPNEKKDANLHISIHSSNSCKLYQRIPGTFWSYYVYTCLGIQGDTLNITLLQHDMLLEQ